MDDESAEIELLEQNLQKTHQISKHMTSILDTFDTRLAKLEKSILPLYTAAQILNRRSHNIDQALSKIDEMASTQEDLAVEEALILRGPQANNIKAYKEALDRLNANIAFKSQDDDSAETARLIETGAKKLTQLYTTLVAEASSSSSSSPTNTTIPSTILQTLTPLVSYLRTLPIPTTHPSHPAANEIFTTLRDAQRGYADMRASWCVKCLEGKGRGVVTSASALEDPTTSTGRRGDPVLGIGREFGEWVRNVLGAVEDEYILLIDLSPLTSTSTATFNTQLLAQSYGTLLAPILKLFTAVLNQLINLIKKSLQKYNFLALSAYDALLGLQPAWDDVLSRRIGGAGEEGSKNEIRDGLNTLRQICLRSFPEFLVDLKVAAMTGNNSNSSAGAGGEREGDTSVGIVTVTTDTVKYLTRIPPLRTAVSSTLMTLGDGNWKMGEGIQVGKNLMKNEEVDESVVLEHFLYDVITNIITSLTTISKTFRRPTYFSSMFLLNNLAYLQHYTSPSSSRSSSSTSSLLSQPTIDYLNSKFRQAKASYLEANFSALIMSISDEPPNFGGGIPSINIGAGAGSGFGGGGGSSKSQAKERFTKFYDILEEVVERHRLARVLWCDDNLSLSPDLSVVNLDYDERERDCLKKNRRDVEDEVVKLVVPPLKRFVMKMKEKDFSRNPQKYIKQSPEEVESRLRSMYD